MSREPPRRLIFPAGGGRRGRLSGHVLPGHRYQDHPLFCRFFADYFLVLRGVCPGPGMAPGSPEALSPLPNHRLPPGLAAHHCRRIYHRHLPDQVIHHPPLFLRLAPGSSGTVSRALPLIPTSNQKTIFCHSEPSEESLILNRRDSQRSGAPFRMT